MKSFFLICFFVVAVAQSAAADDDIDYLAPLTPELEAEALKEFGVESCAEFESYIQNEGEKYEFISDYFNGIRYDIGLCREQNFYDAVNYYKNSIRKLSFLPDPYIRLALIHRYGPVDLRDINQSNGYVKKAVYQLAVGEDPETQKQYIQNCLNGRPIPEFILIHIE